MKIHLLQNQKIISILLLLTAIFFVGCSSKKNQSEDKVLAKIGKKEISVKEFLRRSELNIRPNNFKNKNTTLNNLISEKILTLEAESNKKLLQNPGLQGKLKGIKEQLMRDKLYYEEAYNKVELDSQEIRKAYRLSMREYEVEFYTMRNKELVQKIETLIDSVPELSDELFKELEANIGKKPVHKVNYKDPDDDIIHESLFISPLELGNVVGPMRLSNGNYILIKVLNWVDYPLISGEDQQVRWNEVKEKLHQTKAKKLWQSYLSNLMRGKKIEFDKQSFKTLSNLAFEYYLRNIEKDTLNYQIAEIPFVEPYIDLNAPFFTIDSPRRIDNKLWTVGDFKKELLSHPLVYRTKYLNKNNFAKQFRLAIVDMMRDHYLTQDAYKRSLDDFEEINKTVKMWKDAYLAEYQKDSIINSALKEGIINKDDNIGMLKYWESYMLNLQKRYSHLIQINYDELDKISLTNVDFFAFRPGVPYPIAVPNFPLLISSGNLNYEKQNEIY